MSLREVFVAQNFASRDLPTHVSILSILKYLLEIKYECTCIRNAPSSDTHSADAIPLGDVTPTYSTPRPSSSHAATDDPAARRSHTDATASTLAGNEGDGGPKQNCTLQDGGGGLTTAALLRGVLHERQNVRVYGIRPHHINLPEGRPFICRTIQGFLAAAIWHDPNENHRDCQCCQGICGRFGTKSLLFLHYQGM